MSPKQKAEAGKGFLDIIDEAFHLLRVAPPRALAFYYLGSLPFVLGLIYFWADMGKSAFARERLAGGAFVMALLFIWMKTLQAIYARQLRAEVGGEKPPRWTPIRLFRLATRQAIIQPSGLFLLPPALLALVPFGRAYATYQNMTVLDDGDEGGVRTLFHKAMEQSALWQRQNHFLIWALSPHLMVTAAIVFLVMIPIMAATTPEWTQVFIAISSMIFVLALMPLSPVGIMIAANIATAILAFPWLLKMFLGVETVFVKSPTSLLNGSFFAVVCGLTYLCMDPLMKAAYVLRCFYGESLNTGEDLRVELKRLRAKAKAALVLLPLIAGIIISGETLARENEPQGYDRVVSAVAPDNLDQAVDRELQHRRYAWRMPRISPSELEKEEGLIAAFFRGIAETISEWIQKIVDVMRKIRDWIDKWMPGIDRGSVSPLAGIGEALRIFLYILVAALAFIVAALLWRIWKQRGAESLVMAAKAVEAKPDLDDESTTADELPEEGWLTLARDLIEKGELRHALRALFLASLAHLSRRKMIQIAKFKSNRDYQRELTRYAHAEPETLATFSENMSIFESSWYGVHEVTRELLDRVADNQKRLRVHVSSE